MASTSKAEGVDVDKNIESSLMGPSVPAALYDGVVQNLLTNALKALTLSSKKIESPSIRIEAHNEKKWHIVKISDNGSGIAESIQPYIFDPLFTTTEKRKDPFGAGMGLGLALVRRAVLAFGGKVQLVSPPSGFSTSFEVRLPIQRE